MQSLSKPMRCNDASAPFFHLEALLGLFEVGLLFEAVQVGEHTHNPGKAMHLRKKKHGTMIN
jgi:hypothetical protein